MPAPNDRYTYLPSLGAVRAQGETQWTRLHPARRAELAKIVAPVMPLPAAQLTGVAQPATGASGDGTPWWTIPAVVVATLALLVLVTRYATSALKARPRASKSAN